ncbi:TonB family protein [Rheinheimera sp. NSM]|uniref:TonB family protein n=1 Tax=Rheinheimera sp. NSM TaxID=3457884 RepID=UPI0040368D35
MLLTHSDFVSSNPVAKLAVSGGAALLITALLFSLMQQLVKPATGPRLIPPPAIPVELSVAAQDSDIIVRPQPPVKPEPVIRNIEPVQPPIDVPDRISIGPVDIVAPVLPRSKGLPGGGQQGNRGATPLVKVEPRFPVDAARQGISGWVKLSFSIDEAGAVTDVTVLAAEPGNIFNREAIRALRRWKYQPQVVDGKAIKQTNLQVQLDFSLHSDQAEN